MSMAAQALAPGEASMKLRVIKASGETYELEGDAVVELSPDLEAALLEYRKVVVRARELEAIINGFLKGA